MKKIIFIILSFLLITTSFSQVKNPVKWQTSVEKISETEFNLISNATIENGWHVYSQFTPDNGPLPLVLTFKNQKGNFELVGKAIETPYKKQYNDVFEVDEYYFEKSFSVTQKIKLINFKNAKINLSLEYQACKDACINDNKNLVFNLPISNVETIAKVDTSAVKSSEINLKDIDSTSEISVTPIASNEKLTPNKTISTPEKESKKSNWSIFLLSIIGGILATFTPCIFPMIPMTVSFFLKQSANKSKGKFNALFYGFCIVAIFVLITIPFHLLEGISGGILSEISTNVYVNIFFFLMFVFFALSFFGFYEITMPTSLSNKVDNASNSGGFIGIFFMALTLIIVSFSCIGPALGFVFGTSLQSDGGAKILTVAMFGFGIGLALPFMFFALAPNMLSNLPKSGGWLNTVKVVFGFIELAFAFKFLSNADIGLDLHWLLREVFIVIWILVFAGLSIYLFGKIKFPHDNPNDKISVPRIILGIISAGFTIYLITGLFGSPLKLISAFAPPDTYSFKQISEQKNLQSLPENAVYGPHNIVSFEDYNDGLAYAKSVNKPILIDFTGKQCQNCRLMEANVWSDEAILKIMKNDLVLISLYCDDKKELPKNDQYISKISQSEITTIGQKWNDFEISKFNNNARPYYVLLNLNEEKLNVPVPYTPNTDDYKKWLIDGISKFKK